MKQPRRGSQPEEGREEVFSASGIPIKSLYKASDLAEFDHDRDLGLPGAQPFTRGVYQKMYRRRL